MLATACGPVVGSDDGGTEDGSHGNDTGTMPPSTSLSVSGASADDTVSNAEVAVDSGPDDSPIPDFWDTTPECPQVFEATPIPSQVSLLVDVSQTMATQLVDHDLDPDTPTVTRWRMVANGLAEWLPMLTAQSEVSAFSFPSPYADAPPLINACDAYEVHPYFGATADDLIAYLPAPDAVDFVGATPTGRVYDWTTLELVNLANAPPKHIVLITDGAPNCAQDTLPPELFDEVDADVQSDAAALHAGGITTHVVGIEIPTGTSGGGVEGDAIADHLATLAAIAESGGTVLHEANHAAALDDALTAISRATQSCRLEVPPQLGGYPFAIDIGDDEVYYEIPAELCVDNWGYTFVDGLEGSVVEMCSGACDSLRAYGSASFVEICVIAE